MNKTSQEQYFEKDAVFCAFNPNRRCDGHCSWFGGESMSCIPIFNFEDRSKITGESADEIEAIDRLCDTLGQVNHSVERLGFNGALLHDGPGAIEGLTLALRDTGEKILKAIDRLEVILSK